MKESKVIGIEGIFWVSTERWRSRATVEDNRETRGVQTDWKR